MMRKVSGRRGLSSACPMKREAGASPARSRHRDSRAPAIRPLGDREGRHGASDRSAGRPACRSTGNPGHEALAVRKREVGGICTGLFAVYTPPCGGVSLFNSALSVLNCIMCGSSKPKKGGQHEKDNSTSNDTDADHSDRGRLWIRLVGSSGSS